MIRLTIIAGLLAFITGAAISIPAPLLHSWVSSEEDKMRVYGIGGTLYEGTAVAATAGELRFDTLQWKMNPWALLAFSLTHAVEARNEHGPVAATLSLGPFGGTSIRDASGTLSVQPLIRSARLPLPPMDGALQFVLDGADFDDGRLEEISGSATARGLNWALQRPPLLLGNYRIDLTTTDEVILASLNDQQAELELKGQASLAPDGAYQVDLRLRPSETADRRIDNLLKPLGTPESGGWYRVQQNGRIALPGSQDNGGSPESAGDQS